MNLTKHQVRQHFRQLRRDLTIYQQRSAAKALCNIINRAPIFKQAQTIAAYLPNDGEISPEKIIEQALNLNKQIYLPVVNRTKAMQFRLYSPGNKLIKNQYGIPEPGPSAPTIDIQKLDLVLMPLVAFDVSGNRLGMGGGFYDRAFAKKHAMPKMKPKLIGLAHSIQEAESLETEAWDIPVDGIATEKMLKLI